MYELHDDGALNAEDGPFCRFSQVVQLLEYGLSRRERGRGVLTFLYRQLKRHGCATYEKRWFQLHIVHHAAEGQYSVFCRGLLADLFVERAVFRLRGVETLARWKALHEELRKRRSLERRLVRGKYPRQVLRPDRSKLVRHFRRSALTWSWAVRIIAYATRLPARAVERRLRESWYKNPADRTAVIRLSSGFVIRVDAALPEDNTFVALYSTKSSEHGVYRRLRSRCRTLLRKQGKESSRQRIRIERRQWLLRRARAAAS